MKQGLQLAKWLLVASIVFAAASAWAADARIAVTAESARAEAPVSSVAARAPFILIFDAAGTLVQSHPNPAAANPGGAGPALAAWLAEQGVGTLVAGDFGAKLAQALKDRNIRMVQASGTAGRAAKEARR